MKPYLLALVAALAVVLAHEPFHVWPLAYVGLAVLAHLTWDDALSSRRRGLALMLAGAVHFGVGCHWLLETAWFNWIGMTVPEALTFPAAALIARRMRAFVPRLPRAFVFAIAFGAVEYVRARFPFNGYPWFLIGATQPASMAQVVALIGTSGLGLVLAFAGGSLREFVARRREPAALALHAAAFLVCVGGLFAYSTFCVDVDETAQALGARTRVALVQGNISQQLKHAPKTEREILTVQLRGTRAALAKAGERGFDLLCWAETMFPYPMAHDDAPGTWFTSGFGTDDARAIEREFVAGDLMRGTLKDAHASLLLGAITCSGATPRERADHNSALLFDAEGVRRGRYSKTLLVPGGEFIPLRSILPAVIDRWVEGRGRVLAAARAGRRATPIRVASTRRLGGDLRDDDLLRERLSRLRGGGRRARRRLRRQSLERRLVRRQFRVRSDGGRVDPARDRDADPGGACDEHRDLGDLRCVRAARGGPDRWQREGSRDRRGTDRGRAAAARGQERVRPYG
jgi:apolipoprotein N-acyltransferase